MLRAGFGVLVLLFAVVFKTANAQAAPARLPSLNDDTTTSTTERKQLVQKFRGGGALEAM